MARRELPAERWVWFALAALVMLAPVVAANVPPVLDLAQQTAQIPLLRDALGARGDLYRVTWSAPDKISYPLLALGWWIGGATSGARIGLALCLIAVIGSVHFLAARFDRPVAQAVLASAFVFSSAFYGGFLNFVLGGWALALWLDRLRRPAEEGASPRRELVVAAAVGLLLYWSHLLWLLAALALTLVAGVSRRQRGRDVAFRLLGLSPFVLAAAAWALAARAAGDASVAVYETPIWRRFVEPAEWPRQLWGGVRGPLEPIAWTVLGVWVLVAWLGGRRSGQRGHGLLALAAAIFAGALLLLPDLVGDTFLFARRWGMWVGVCGVLALPPLPRFGRRGAAVLALALLGLFAGVTAWVWRDFSREEMRGFDTCRAAVPDGSRLLFLDLARVSPRFWVFPTLQMAAYARLDRPVETNFSFAEHPSSLVVYRTLPHTNGWTPKLEVFPERLAPSDLERSDRVLLHLPEARVDDVARRFPTLREVAGEGSWRLYSVEEGR